jgi:hypothetical protein
VTRTEGGLLFAAGLLLGAAAFWQWQRRGAAQWEERATAATAVADSAMAVAERATVSAYQWRVVAESLRARRDTLIVTRWRTVLDTAFLAADSTLPACLASKEGLRATCKRSADSLGAEIAQARTESDSYRNSLTEMTRSDSAKRVAVDSLRALIRAVPRQPAKWLGLFSPPKVMVGIGCAGGSGFGCGVMAGIGVTF